MAPTSYQLVLRSGPNAGKEYELSKSEITIGRDISNDVVVSDAEVSRHHARLYVQGEDYVLEDTGSTNGTFVDGQRLMGPHILRSGEVILLGENVSLAFEPTEFDPDATRVARVAAVEEPAHPERESFSRAAAFPEPEPYPQAPEYYDQGAPGPVEDFPVPPETQKSNTTKWVLASCGVITLCVCAGLIAMLFYIDSNRLYCEPPFRAFFELITTCP